MKFFKKKRIVFLSKNIYFIIIFIGLFISILNSIVLTKKNDFFYLSLEKKMLHKIIQSDIYHYWSEADKIKRNYDISHSISEFSRPLERNYLYPKLIAFYHILSKKNVLDEQGNANINDNKFLIPIIQSLIYYLALIFFFLKIKKILKPSLNLLIILYLAFAPSIMAYNTSYWTESIYLSLFLVYISNLIVLPKKIFGFYCLGILLGIMYLQRTSALYLIIPTIIFIFFFCSSKKIKSIFLTCLGLSTILVAIGYENFKRSGVFYFKTLNQSNALYHHVSHYLNSKKYSISQSESWKIKNEDLKKFLKHNDVDKNNEADRIKLAKYEIKYFMNSLENNFFTFAKYHLYKSLQALMVISVDNAYFKYTNPEKFWLKKEYKQKLYINWMISILYYFVCFFGLLTIFRQREKIYFKIIFLTFILISYKVAILGWVGVERYMVTNIIVLSFLFCFGIHKLLTKSKFFFHIFLKVVNFRVVK
jgi:hypothetical protein